jgi:hypothetical protein
LFELFDTDVGTLCIVYSQRLLFAVCAAAILCGYVGVWQLFRQWIMLDVAPELQAIQQYSWRQYHAKGKDVQYAALQVRIVRSTYSMNCSIIGGSLHHLCGYWLLFAVCAAAILCIILLYSSCLVDESYWVYRLSWRRYSSTVGGSTMQRAKMCSTLHYRCASFIHLLHELLCFGGSLCGYGLLFAVCAAAILCIILLYSSCLIEMLYWMYRLTLWRYSSTV